jgi:hypothetical protein
MAEYFKDKEIVIASVNAKRRNNVFSIYGIIQLFGSLLNYEHAGSFNCNSTNGTLP